MSRQQHPTATRSTLRNLCQDKEGKIALCVQGEKESDEKFFYSIARDAELDVLKRDYTQRIGVPLNFVRFLYDDHEIQWYPTLRPSMLKMKDGDIINVVQRSGQNSLRPRVQLNSISFLSLAQRERNRYSCK
ncbi:Small ubiquitin-related modifier, SUMO [Corchorus olitorius]|uniref:Small ubiquitin-related modifier, SUMO n=1 Tax=Corchorus olitorius TaxID=93759 RepID=A0A1R3IZF2_9ROSI|nr:Small ubiquitin-related modifier, SUMO [Corchorus olitorius]